MSKEIICLCWLSECNCQFQHHKGYLTLCESKEIFDLCISKKDEDINFDGG